MKVLIVEDESIVAMEIESFVHSLGYHVIDICSKGEEALAAAKEGIPDIILMDICLKGKIDGIETASLIKASLPRVQIVFLTAHMDDYNVDRAILLDPVAYLSKPFHHEELRVSLKIAAQKRAGKGFEKKRKAHHIYLDDEFCYDTRKTMLYYCEEPLHLTKKESELLNILIEHKNRIVNAYTIENTLWPEKDITSNTLRTLVRRLREKLKYKFVETVAGRGYIFIVKYNDR